MHACIVLAAGWGAAWFMTRSVAGEPVRLAFQALSGVLRRVGLAFVSVPLSYGPTGGVFPLTDPGSAGTRAVWNVVFSRIYALPRLEAVFAWAGFLPIALVSTWLTGVVECAACMGFWIGLALGSRFPVALEGFGGALVTGFVLMGVSSVLNPLIGTLGLCEHVLHVMVEKQLASERAESQQGNT